MRQKSETLSFAVNAGIGLVVIHVTAIRCQLTATDGMFWHSQLYSYFVAIMPERFMAEIVLWSWVAGSGTER